MIPSKVLVIEDQERVRELFEIFLTKKGLNVVSCGHGIEGVNLARAQKPSIIMIDVKLPDIDGIEVLTRIREFDKESKIFVLSGLYTEEVEKEAMAAGATAFLSKSSGIDVIVNAVLEAKNNP